jgi:uncharacterized protein YndB with AHSA1/START domain
MRIHHEIEINKPVEAVFDLFRDRQLMSRWQPGLVSSEEAKQKGGNKTFKNYLKIGRRTMPVTEIIQKDMFPNYNVIYELKGIVNKVENTFHATPSGSTRWESVSTFRFKGLMKIIAPFMRSGLEQQSRIIMQNFKNFVHKYNA